MKKYILVLLLFGVLGNAKTFAQADAIMRGDESFDFFLFQDAIKHYEEALKTPNIKTEAHVYNRLAECHMYLFQYKKAAFYFDKLVKLGDNKADPDAYLNYGNVLKALGEYERARDQYSYYRTIIKDDPYAAFLVRSVNWAIASRDSIRNYQISKTNLDISGMASGHDFMDNGIVYAHGRNKPANLGMPILDLDYAINKDSTHFMADEKYLEELNFTGNENAPSVSADGEFLYFSANAAKTSKSGAVKKKGTETSDDNVVNLQLYVAMFDNGRYRNPVALPFNNKQYNFTHPFITQNGNVLFFVSDMPNGLGGLDIYKVMKQHDGKWGQPINLGPKINSEENDMYPYVSKGILFYTSKGLNGYGGYDIYVNVLDKNLNPTSPTRNIGKPINSERDDVALISKDGGVTGYFASNRGNDEGEDHVFYFIDRDLAKIPTLPAIAAAPKKPEPVKVLIPPAEKEMPKETTPPVASSTVTKPPVKQPVQALQPKPAKPKQTPAQPKSSSSETDENLVSRVFPNVIFKFNQAGLNTDAHLTLDSVITAMKLSKTLKVYISAHTDSRGNAVYNLRLSDKRAIAARLYLTARGISSSRIITKGFGESQLLNNCADGVECTEEEHTQNRRVDLKLISE